MTQSCTYVIDLDGKVMTALPSKKMFCVGETVKHRSCGNQTATIISFEKDHTNDSIVVHTDKGDATPQFLLKDDK